MNNSKININIKNIIFQSQNNHIPIHFRTSPPAAFKKRHSI